MYKIGFFILFFLFSNHLLVCQTTGGQMKWILPLATKPEPIGSPSETILPFRKGHEVFLQNLSGQQQSIAYDSISYEYGTFWKVWKGGLQGIIKLNNGEVLPPVYSSVDLVDKSETNWAFIVLKYGMMGVVSDKNKLILPYSASSYQNLTLVRDSILEYKLREFSYVSKSGNKVLESVALLQKPPEFQRVSSNKYVFAQLVNGKVVRDSFVAAEKFIENFAMVKRDSLWGYLKTDGSWLIKPRFQAALPFNALGYAVVKSDGKYGVIRKNGTYALNPHYTFLKPFTDELFEYKENGLIGLTDTLDKVILPAGVYGGFQMAGTECIAAKSADSLLIFQRNGQPIHINGIRECSKKVYDPQILLKQKINSKDNQLFSGLMASDGKWIISPVLTRQVKEGKYFIIAEASAQPCCIVGQLNIGTNQPGKFLIFDRKGNPMLTLPVDEIQNQLDEPFIIYKVNKKFGLITKTGNRIDPEYDELISMGNGWVYAKKGIEKGALKWVEE